MAKLNTISSAYLIGIKGAGMAALATLLHARGIAVSGSDTDEKFHTDDTLRHAGIPFTEGFSKHNVPTDVDCVIHSTTYTADNNEEMQALMDTKTLLLSYPEALGMLLTERCGIAVTGTHGKTTVTALLAHVLDAADLAPSAIVGAYVPQWGSNALTGDGQHFIVEADEYQNKLAHYEPLGAVLTNIDWDHPDFFATEAAYDRVFEEFVERLPRHGFLVVCADSEKAMRVARRKATSQVLSYGFTGDAQFVISDHELITLGEEPGVVQKFSLADGDKDLGAFHLKLSGKHNALNAAAVVVVAQKLGVPTEKIKAGLKDFTGAARRFEFKGMRGDTLLFDDYAHHPEEIRATLRAAHDRFSEKKIIAVFHPHTHSRTEGLMNDFAQSFGAADEVIVLDVYASAREGGNPGRSTELSQELVKRIDAHGVQRAKHCPTFTDAATYLKENLAPDTVLITLGAGDVWKMHEQLADAVQDEA